MAKKFMYAPLPQKFEAAHAYFEEADDAYEYSPEQAAIDDVKAALAEWELEAA